jgi:hypothetical protein
MNASQVISRAAGQGESDRLQIQGVAFKAPALGEVVSGDSGETASVAALPGTELVGQAQTTGQLAHQFEQGQVRARLGLAAVGSRLGDADRTAGDGASQHRLQLAEARLALDDAAQIVLIEVEEDHPRHAIVLLRRWRETGFRDPCVALTANRGPWRAADPEARGGRSGGRGE